METSDIVVVGAGIAGIGFAWCAAGERRVRIVEQGPQPLAEASAQNAGMLRRFVLPAEERAMACRTRVLIDEIGAGLAPADRPFRRTGAVLALARPDPRYAAAAPDLASRGVAVEPIDRRALAELAPAMDGSPVASAWYLPDEGVVDAWTLGHRLLGDAADRGAELSLDTRVTGLSRDGDRVVGVRTDRGPIAAELVVLAAGAWAEPIARESGIESPVLQPKARHLLRTAEHPLAHRDHPWCWIDDVGVYVRPEAGGFLVSPCDETDLRPAPGPGSSRAVTLVGRATAQEKLAAWFPRLADLRTQDGWVGLRTFEPVVRAPHIAQHPGGGLLWLAGLGGSGISCGLAAAERACELAGLDQKASQSR